MTTETSNSQKRVRPLDPAAEPAAASVPTTGDGQREGGRDGNPRVAEAWVSLCAQAAVEKDPKRLLELVKEINRLLDVRRQRLAHDTTQNVKE